MNTTITPSLVAADMASMPPGTELMRNTTNHHMVELQKSHQVLVPTPSNDPADPLNWSLTWKLIVITNQALFVMCSILPALSIAPVTPIFIHEFQASPATVSLFLGVCVITLGYMNFILVPFSNIFGRRSTCLITGAIIVGSNIWQASAEGTSSFFGARILNGVGGAVNETVMIQVIADIFFLHERGKWMGVYFAAYFLGCFIGPMIAGTMAQSLGWRSFFWLCTGVSSLNLLGIVFLFPETKYHRPVTDGQDLQQQVTTLEDEKTHDIKVVQDESSSDFSIVLGKGRPRKSQWLPARKPYPGAVKFLVRNFVTPVYSLSFPIIFWAVIVMGASSNTLLVMNLTQSPVFGGPPYLFTPGSVGLVNLSFVVGGLIAMVTAGPLSDWVAKRMTIKNNDIREPEMRLWAMVPYFAAMVIGCLVIILGYAFAWPWQAIVIFGYTCVGLQVVALPTIAIAYAVDSYKPISGEILVMCTVFKNTFGFGMSYWTQYLTPTQSVIVLFVCNVAACLLGIPMYFFGKKLRIWTRNSKVHSMEAII